MQRSNQTIKQSSTKARNKQKKNMGNTLSDSTSPSDAAANQQDKSNNALPPM